MLTQTRTEGDVSTAILSAGERAFAEFGYAGASMRGIARDAGVNQAMIAYYFGSKEGLLHAIMRRRSSFVNAQRDTRLAALREKGQPTVDDLIEAFLAPLIELATDEEQGGYSYVKMLAVFTHSVDEVAKRVIAENFDGIARRFTDAFREIEPQMTESDAIRAYLLSLGAGIAAVGIANRAGRMSERYDHPETAKLLRAVVAFSSAGVRALMHGD
ncbi:TetR/AcrR family transcriptional regulator [Aquibium microcysteis]|uniref:TetR/AcrR family transcriptional regulator n=1 Tax=Aquibium microcysteis TaxID=675281 RepID=UPI00165D22B3|nr:TetR/AcrR family transcriptional regulator [Aquibium microcysteis]